MYKIAPALTVLFLLSSIAFHTHPDWVGAERDVGASYIAIEIDDTDEEWGAVSEALTRFSLSLAIKASRNCLGLSYALPYAAYWPNAPPAHEIKPVFEAV